MQEHQYAAVVELAILLGCDAITLPGVHEPAEAVSQPSKSLPCPGRRAVNDHELDARICPR
jgi:hypothetical protein